jgi:hypothetical protein
MQLGVLATDGGPHPPEKWAEATADQIIDIGSTAPQALLSEARTLRAKLVAILTPHHDRVQQHERGALAAKGDAHLETPLDPSPHIDDPVAEIVAAAKGTSFAAHFQRPEVQQYLRDLIGHHFASAMHIERQWHPHRRQGA